jgi:stage V sporulation protein AB
MRQIFLTLIGFSAGFTVAGGVVALMTGLGIIIRFIGLSHTAGKILWHENAILLGAIVGTILTVYQVHLPIGAWILVPAGLFTGIFVGGWIMALAEIINVFPVYFRRLGITKGISGIVVALAAGKTAGSLLIFFMRWGKG